MRPELSRPCCTWQRRHAKAGTEDNVAARCRQLAPEGPCGWRTCEPTLIYRNKKWLFKVSDSRTRFPSCGHGAMPRHVPGFKADKAMLNVTEHAAKATCESGNRGQRSRQMPPVGPGGALGGGGGAGHMIACNTTHESSQPAEGTRTSVGYGSVM